MRGGLSGLCACVRWTVDEPRLVADRQTDLALIAGVTPTIACRSITRIHAMSGLPHVPSLIPRATAPRLRHPKPDSRGAPPVDPPVVSVDPPVVAVAPPLRGASPESPSGVSAHAERLATTPIAARPARLLEDEPDTVFVTPARPKRIGPSPEKPIAREGKSRTQYDADLGAHVSPESRAIQCIREDLGEVQESLGYLSYQTQPDSREALGVLVAHHLANAKRQLNPFLREGGISGDFASLKTQYDLLYEAYLNCLQSPGTPIAIVAAGTTAPDKHPTPKKPE